MQYSNLRSSGLLPALIVWGFLFCVQAQAQADSLSTDNPILQQAKKANIAGRSARQQGDLDQAADYFRQAAELAYPISGLVPLQYRLNAARIELEIGKVPQALHRLDEISADLKQQALKAPLLHVSLAELYRRAVNEFGQRVNYRLRAFDHLRTAATLVTDDPWLDSYINGYLAALYEDEARYVEALHYNRLAVLAAQKTQLADPLFRWEWQLARTLAHQGETAAAVAAYDRTVASLQRVRHQLESDDGATFTKIVRPIFFQYADLLLQQAAGTPSEQQALLQRAREVLEAVKVAEVEDYFQESCVTDTVSTLDLLTSGTAIIYPVMLEDRLELIISVGDTLSQQSVPVTRQQLTATVRDFRLNIQIDTATEDYLRLGRQLYDWLLLPLESTLQDHQVDTLVFIPDGPLRTIPMSALFDGKQFAVERYAFATAPGLTLVKPRARSEQRNQTLAAGLSESVQGFRALPSVDQELQTIAVLLPTQVIKNQSFTKMALSQELVRSDYNIVHLATHGQFRSDYSDSYLLTHDDRLRMDELGDLLLQRRARENVLDLLVLSACETAAGDDRAALGLAGVATQSGARTALASLWEVDDTATQQLIAKFYRNLVQKQPLSKAASLSEAQRALIAQEAFRHPSQWAPFLLIGDWL